MKTFDIKGVERKDIGKKATKALRVDELVPCVLYGGKNNIHFAVEEKAFQYLDRQKNHSPRIVKIHVYILSNVSSRLTSLKFSIFSGIPA